MGDLIEVLIDVVGAILSGKLGPFGWLILGILVIVAIIVVYASIGD